MQGSEFLAVTVANGENVLLNIGNVKLFKPRDHEVDGATVVLMDGTQLHIRDDFNALALRLAFLPVPPRSRDQLALFGRECVACGHDSGSADLCGYCAAETAGIQIEYGTAVKS